MRSPLRYERVHIVWGLICWLDGEIVGLMPLTRLCPLDDIVMVAETLRLTCLMHQQPGLTFPSFVSCDL
jgi:hypothetical protein